MPVGKRSSKSIGRTVGAAAERIDAAIWRISACVGKQRVWQPVITDPAATSKDQPVVELPGRPCKPNLRSKVRKIIIRKILPDLDVRPDHAAARAQDEISYYAVVRRDGGEPFPPQTEIQGQISPDLPIVLN